MQKKDKNKIFTKSLKGFFGEGEFKFGGCYVPESLLASLKELQKAYKNIFKSKKFQKELKYYATNFIGRPTPLIYAKNSSKILNNEIYLKFEGLANTGAHKINNAIAQTLLAKKMGKTKVIAETGAGQHGLATATACALLNIECTIYMGELDAKRQRPNVFLMERLGAKVVRVTSGDKTLKDAVNEALRVWSATYSDTFYVLGSALGPNPYPDMVRDAQSIIGKEIKKQARKYSKKDIDCIIACVGGGSNAMGAFSAFLKDKKVRLLAVEGGGIDNARGNHASRLTKVNNTPLASIGIAHGYKSYFLQTKDLQLDKTHSISAGLDYAGVSPQLAHLNHIKRVEFINATDTQALEAMEFFAKNEGIIAALESSHALAGALKYCQDHKNEKIVIHVSGRGDKDIFITAKMLDKSSWSDFLALELEEAKKIKS